MKPRCPVPGCIHELSSAGAHILCATHYIEVPLEMKKAIARAPLIIRNARKPMAVSAAFKNQRLARERAVQFVMDQHNSKQKVSA